MNLLKIAGFIPITPKIRGYIYKLSFKNKIGRNFKIGLGSYIDSKDISIGDNVTIGNLVRIKYLDKFQLGDACSIGSSTIICGSYDSKKFSDRFFVCGNNVEILCSHYFDVVAPIIMNNDITIGGKYTQFYTHSFDLKGSRLDGSISVGSNVYIGAGCIINLGVNICDEVVISAGTVVSKSIEKSGVYASNILVNRGMIREYSELYSNYESGKLSDKKKVFLKI